MTQNRNGSGLNIDLCKTLDFSRFWFGQFFLGWFTRQPIEQCMRQNSIGTQTTYVALDGLKSPKLTTDVTKVMWCNNPKDHNINIHV
jgi:hypothetical protein